MLRSAAVVLLALAVAGPARAARDPFGPGSLDASFAKNGIALTRMRLWEARAIAVATDDDGRVYVLATGHRLARFLPNGRLDVSYGHRGFASVPQPMLAFDGNGYATTLYVDQDGNAVVAGLAKPDSIYVARFTNEGERADSFGDLGVAVVRLPVWALSIPGVVIGPQGRIVVGESVYDSANAGVIGHLLLVGLTAGGQLDRTFGEGGIASSPPVTNTYYGSGALMRLGTHIAVATTLGGYFVGPQAPTPMLLMSNLSGGDLTAQPLPVGFAPSAARTRDDGGAYVVGSDDNGRSSVASLTPDGALDPRFGRGGIARVGGGARALAVHGNGLVVARSVSSPGRSMAITRLTARGRVDRRFGVSGTATVRVRTGGFAGRGYASADAVVYDAVSNRIFVAGGYGDGTDGGRDDEGGDVVELAAMRPGRSLATIRARGRLSGSSLVVSVGCRSLWPCALRVRSGAAVVRLHLRGGRRRSVALRLGPAARARVRDGGTATVTVLASSNATHDGIVAAVRG